MEYIKKGGKTLKLTSNALTLLFYKKEFRSDFFSDLLKLSKSTAFFEKIDSIDKNKKNNKNKNLLNDVTYDELEQLDMILLYQILWAMAKTADKQTKSFLDFMNKYSDFMLDDILPPLQRLLEKSFRTKKK